MNFYTFGSMTGLLTAWGDRTVFERFRDDSEMNYQSLERGTIR